MQKLCLALAGAVVALAVVLRPPACEWLASCSAAGGGVGMAGVYLALVTPALVAEDVARRRLPNALTYPGLALVGLVGGPTAVLVALAAAVFLLLPAAAGAVGMGDVKLAALLVGTMASLRPADAIGVGLTVAAVVTVAAGGVMALANTVWARCRERAGPNTIAFGPALLAGFWVAFAAVT